MFNWYAMGVNAPSSIDEARDRARAARAGDDYATFTRRAHMSEGVTRSGSIRGWRATPFAVATFKG